MYHALHKQERLDLYKNVLLHLTLSSAAEGKHAHVQSNKNHKGFNYTVSTLSLFHDVKNPNINLNIHDFFQVIHYKFIAGVDCPL